MAFLQLSAYSCTLYPIMRFGILHGNGKRQFILGLMLSIVFMFLLSETVYSYCTAQLPFVQSESQIFQSNGIVLSPNLTDAKHGDQKPVVKTSYKYTITPVSTSFVDIMRSDVPPEKTPLYHHHIIYTLITSSGL
jgi:hypothetical protein